MSAGSKKRKSGLRPLSIVQLVLTIIMNVAFVIHFFAIADTLKDGLSMSVVSTVVLLLEYGMCMIPCCVLLLILVIINLTKTRLFVRGWEISAAVLIAWCVAEYFLLINITGIWLGVVLIVSAILPNILPVFEVYTYEKAKKDKKTEQC